MGKEKKMNKTEIGSRPTGSDQELKEAWIRIGGVLLIFLCLAIRSCYVVYMDTLDFKAFLKRQNISLTLGQLGIPDAPNFIRKLSTRRRSDVHEMVTRTTFIEAETTQTSIQPLMSTLSTNNMSDNVFESDASSQYSRIIETQNIEKNIEK